MVRVKESLKYGTKADVVTHGRWGWEQKERMSRHKIRVRARTGQDGVTSVPLIYRNFFL